MNIRCKIVVIGGSAGGLVGLQDLVRRLPSNLNAAVFVVLHIPPGATSRLPQILGRHTSLPASHPADGEAVVPGRIYVAQPDHHMLVQGNRINIKKGPKENRFRPSIDALFRSAAYTCRTRVIGVVLSGVLDDGVSGLWAIKELGGVTTVQDPEEAAFDSMPASALAQVDVDRCAPAGELGALIARLCAEPEPEPGLESRLATEVAISASDNAFERGSMDLGELTLLTCPECQGALTRITEGNLIRFRCHTGHACAAAALLSSISESIEAKLMQAMRAMEESVMLLEHLGQHMRAMGKEAEAEGFFGRARQTRASAHALHDQALEQESRSEIAARDTVPRLIKRSR